MKLSFEQQFIKFIRENELFSDLDHLLVAVSGGSDSVLLAHLLKKLHLKFSIAHCNFKLRGEESEGDELFVSNLADELNVPIYVKHFSTDQYATDQKVSIQMAARALRYSWFQEILKKEKINYIITAHHKDDLAETVLLNLSKGSVLNGLHGIKPKNNNIVRPLLWASKNEIKKYIAEEKISYREDSSNHSSKYQRNLIRHQIFPEFEKINPSFSETILQTSLLRNQINNWFETYCLTLKDQLFSHHQGILSCAKEALIKFNEAIIFELIRTYNFTPHQAINIYKALKGTESKEFNSKTHRIIIDRSLLQIIPIIEHEKNDGVLVFEEGNYIYQSQIIHFNFTKYPPAQFKQHPPHIAYLDADKIIFPLQIRVWKNGDYFQPFGMQGNKKISDYLTDIKQGKYEKEHQLVVVSEDIICWVVNKRIDERFKIDETTERILKIEVLNHKNETLHS